MSQAYKNYVIEFAGGLWYFNNHGYNTLKECQEAVDLYLVNK